MSVEYYSKLERGSLDAITSPAIVVDNRSDLLATNLLGRAMHSDLYAVAQRAHPRHRGQEPASPTATPAQPRS